MSDSSISGAPAVAAPGRKADAGRPTARRSSALVGYVVAVDLLAAAILVSWDKGDVVDHGLTVIILGLLAGLTGIKPVRVPALRTEVTTNDAFALCALGAVGPVAAALVSVAGVVGAAFGLKRRPAPIRFLFNLGAVPFSMMVAWTLFATVGGRSGGPLPEIALPLAVATTAYFLVNTGLVTGAIALEKGERFWTIWSRSSLWTAVSAFTGLSLGAVLIFLLQLVGPWGFILGVPPAWLLATFFRTNQSRIEERDDRISSVEEQNAELERKVTERTRSLRELLAHLESMNRQLRESNERLTEASRIKSEFLANVSHELRTPLNAVIGFSDLLADTASEKLTDTQKEYLADIRSSGEHLLHLINNILDLSKIEAGKLQATLRDVDIPDLLRESAAMLRPLSTSRGIALSVQAEAGIATARIDPGMAREVVANLLSNAVKFTPAGGSVRLAARRQDHDLVVEVRDSGIGIAPEHQARIFDEFYQVDGSYSRNYQGTGLGLSLVQRIMKLHGGRISLESEPGRGSCFTCVFPECLAPAEKVPENRPEAAESVPPSGAFPAQGRIVLLVEDNPLNRKLAKNALRSGGYQVVEATSGEQALELLQERRPDLILMDLQLPGMDGLETTRRIKADPANSGVRIVALTAHVRTLDEDRARSAGCEGYITKPIRLTRFKSQVESYFIAREGAA